MIEIGGIQFKQATDYSIVAYSGSKYVLIADGNTPQRVLMSSLAENSHNHSGQVLLARAIQPPVTETTTSIWGPVGTSSNIIIYQSDSGKILINSQNGVSQIQGQFVDLKSLFGDGNNGIRIIGTSGYRTALADGWNLYACSVRNKTDILPITNAITRLQKLDGITFKQDGVSRSGFTAEGLDELGTPDATVKRDGQYESINPFAPIPVLVQAIKELQQQIDILKQQIRG